MTDLRTLENEADSYLDTWKQAYWNFIQKILAIRDSEAWLESGAGTWEQYLTTRWLPHLDVGYARIRQLQAAFDVMQVVRDVTGVSLNESQIRTLKAIVPDEYRYLLPEIVSRTHAYTSSPARRHYEATYNVLLEREATATVTVEGVSHNIDVVQAATVEACLEVDLRRNEHIGTNSKYELVNRYEFASAFDARQALNNLAELQSIESGMQIVVTVRRLKPDVTSVTVDDNA